VSDEKKFLKALPDRLVLDPVTRKKLDDAGEWKPWNTHWARKVAHGDVVETQPQTEVVKEVENAADDVGGTKSRKRVRE
jgi:hypothetical protein